MAVTSGSTPAGDSTDGADVSPETPQAPVSRRGTLATGLMIGAAVVLVGTVVLLGRGGALPAVIGVDDSASEPVFWTKSLALPVAAIAVVMLALLSRQVAWWARLFAAVCAAAFLAVCGWLAWQGLPEPGPAFGLGRRIPWAVVGCAVGVMAAVAYAAGAALRWRTAGARAGRVLTPVVAALVVLVLAAGTLAGVRAADDWTAAQNLEVEHADGPLAGQRPSTLDGTKRWRALSSDDVTATRGGIVVSAGPGIYAIDPTTGRQRWHYFRWGSSFEGTPVASADGRYVTGTAGLDSGLARFLSGGSSEGTTYIFDAVRGRLLSTVDTHGGWPRYVDGHVLVVDDGQEYPDSITAYRHGGSRAWHLAFTGECTLGAVIGLGEDVLVGRNCDGRAKVSVRDSTTGRERWHWEHEGYVSPNGIVVPGSGPGAGTVVLDLPSEDSDGDERGRDQHVVTALEAETGQTRWSRADVRLGSAKPDEGTYAHVGLYTSGTLVLAGSRKYADDDRGMVELVGLDPASGKRRWHDVAALDYLGYQDYALPTFRDPGLGETAGVVDGHIVLSGKKYRGRGNGDLDAVAIRAVDAKTGDPVRSVLLHGGRTDLDEPEVLHVVGDTVVLAASGNDSHDRYLVGLG